MKILELFWVPFHGADFLYSENLQDQPQVPGYGAVGIGRRLVMVMVQDAVTFRSFTTVSN